jgi:predicted PurR-regulated permease PerM
MGRGSKTPMLVLFMGSLGGFISGGILGLFVGAVVLSIGYTIFIAWLDHSGDEPDSAASAVAEPESSPKSP